MYLMFGRNTLRIQCMVYACKRNLHKTNIKAELNCTNGRLIGGPEE